MFSSDGSYKESNFIIKYQIYSKMVTLYLKIMSSSIVYKSILFLAIKITFSELLSQIEMNPKATWNGTWLSRLSYHINAWGGYIF